MQNHKQGNITLSDASAAAVAFVLFVIVVGIGSTVLAGIQSSQQNTACANYTTNTSCWTAAQNITGQGLTGMLNLGNQAGTIGTVLGAAILIGIVVSAFYFSKRE